MNWLTVARAAKAAALVFFLLPWLVVSCDGTPVAQASGLGLALGNVETAHTQAAEYARVHLWALIALGLTIGALVIGFVVKPPERAGRMVAGATGGALALCVLGMAATIGGARNDLLERGQTLAAESLKFDVKGGYWLTLMALALATWSAWALYRGRAFPTPPAPATAPATEAQAADPVPPAAPPAEPPRPAAAPDASDEAYWDSLPDKTDPAALEEYIYRFPDGRFVGLARERLARASEGGNGSGGAAG